VPGRSVQRLLQCPGELAVSLLLLFPFSSSLFFLPWLLFANEMGDPLSKASKKKNFFFQTFFIVVLPHVASSSVSLI
jgi:hypothetical protein